MEKEKMRTGALIGAFTVGLLQAFVLPGSFIWFTGVYLLICLFQYWCNS